MKKNSKKPLLTRARRWFLRETKRTLLLIYTRIFCSLRRINAGSGTIIYPGAKMTLLGGGKITIGKQCIFHPGSLVATYGGSIEIGDNVSLNDYAVLYGHGGLVIGDGTRIATHSVVVPANHCTDPSSPIWTQGLTKLGIVIGQDVWIGAGVRILDGVKVPDGCVLAAGAVIHATIGMVEFGIYGGVPAKMIGSRLNDVA